MHSFTAQAVAWQHRDLRENDLNRGRQFGGAATAIAKHDALMPASDSKGEHGRKRTASSTHWTHYNMYSRTEMERWRGTAAESRAKIFVES